MRRKKILKMKLPFIFISFIFCATIGSLLLPGSVRGSCQINDISLEKVDNFTKLTIYADKPFEFVHSTVEKKDGRPYRVVIDCKDAIHNLPQHNFKKDLPCGTIKAIRTSQFQSVPERIVRIVLDLDKPIIYKVVEKGEEARGAIAILTAQAPSFSLWAAVGDEKEPSKIKLAPSSFVEKTSEAKDNILSSSENSSRFDLTQPENAKAEEVKKRTTFEKPLCFADTSETDTKSQVSMIKPETTKKDQKIKQKASRQTRERMVLATAVTSPEVFSAPNQKDKRLQSEQLEDRKVGTGVEKRDLQKTSPRHSDKQEFVQKKPSSSQKEALSWSNEVEKTAKETTEESRAGSTNLTARGAKEYIGKKPLSSQEEAMSSAGEDEKATKVPPEGNKTGSLNPVAEEEKVALVSPEEKSAQEKVESPESLVVISKPEGTALGVVPQRRIIYYHSEGKRDPFVPLTERMSTELGEISLPTFESLELVGVLKDEAGNRALLEDERGYGYIMKNGDKIKNGYVVSVEDNKVIFQIQEYGWSKTIALELSN